MKIGKYEFNSKAQAQDKIADLDEGHTHTIVELGNIVLVQGTYDDEGNEITSSIFSDKYHVDVLWNGLNNHPFGWKSASININDNGVHSFCGLDYQKNKF